MKRMIALVALGVLVFMTAGSTLGQNAELRNLEIYWVDVEGGQATLFVSPTGESLLYEPVGNWLPRSKNQQLTSDNWSVSC